MSTAYYNENSPKPVAMLREIVDADEIAKGDIDDRSITDVQCGDVGSGQAHWFAGIGGWSVALRLAGIDDEAPVWTGSCPCQPFSQAGNRGGVNDERHLWPVWRSLIAAKKPPVVLGEQTSSPLARKEWMPAVLCDFEQMGYIAHVVDTAAGGTGAPHQRSRLWWAAILPDALGDAYGYRTGRDSGAGSRTKTAFRFDHWGIGHVPVASGGRNSYAVGDTAHDLFERQGVVQLGSPSTPRTSSRIVWLPCEEGVLRPTLSGLCPLADGLPARSPLVHAFGNAIVPQVAAEFITDVWDWMGVAS